ncbi:MAG: LON peptidase substrate-binding domain-containing protein, partial [candidate division NC10 bacterium]
MTDAPVSREFREKEDSAGIVLPDIIAILPLRDTVLFPDAVLPLAVGRAPSIRLVAEAVQGSRIVGAVAQRDPSVEEAAPEDLFSTGTATIIHKMFKHPDGTLRLVVQGVTRIRVVEIVQTAPFIKARIEVVPETPPAAGDIEAEALTRNAATLFQKIVALSPTLPDELMAVAMNASDPGRLADFIAASLPSITTAVKQELLETADVKLRLKKLVESLTKETEVLELGSKIQSQVQSELSKTQREYYLREQLKAIQKELGDVDERTHEIEELRQKIERAGMTEEAKKEAVREIDRLSKMPPAAAEYTVSRTYLDWLIALPWQRETEDQIDIANARRILDEDHWGLDKVKERILEYLAVKKIRPGGKDPIICFVGPPGVGKTSLGKSIARALGRRFHRISLGGMACPATMQPISG